MISILCKNFYIDVVLRKAGYERHHKDEGYVKDLDAFTRWHAFPVKNSIELHLDKTNDKNRHYVARVHNQETQEAKRIESFISRFTPKGPKIKHKDEFAPNLLEIQRNHKAKIIKQRNFLVWFRQTFFG